MTISSPTLLSATLRSYVRIKSCASDLIAMRVPANSSIPFSYEICSSFEQTSRSYSLLVAIALGVILIVLLAVVFVRANNRHAENEHGIRTGVYVTVEDEWKSNLEWESAMLMMLQFLEMTDVALEWLVVGILIRVANSTDTPFINDFFRMFYAIAAGIATLVLLRGMWTRYKTWKDLRLELSLGYVRVRVVMRCL